MMEGQNKESRHTSIFNSMIYPSMYLYSTAVYAGLPGDSDSKESACNAGDLSLIPGSGRSPREGNGNPLA